jgi:hypothetical protein
MNKRNIKNIKERCRNHNINIIPIDQHITSMFLGKNLVTGKYQLKPILENIIKDFSIVIDDVILRKIKRLRFI